MSDTGSDSESHSGCSSELLFIGLVEVLVLLAATYPGHRRPIMTAHPLIVMLFSLRLSVVLLVGLLTAAPAAGRGATGSGSEGGASDALIQALELSEKGAYQNEGLDSISGTVTEIINEVRRQIGGTPQDISSTTGSTGTAPRVEVSVPRSSAHKLQVHVS